MADTIKIGNLEIDNLKVGTLSVDALYIGDVKIYPPTPPTPTGTCYEVISTPIASYTATTYDSVFTYNDAKWYMKNNLNQYEEYGIYDSANTLSSLTYYEGKLAVIGETEYQYSGGSWVVVGSYVDSSVTYTIDDTRPSPYVGQELATTFKIPYADVESIGLVDLSIRDNNDGELHIMFDTSGGMADYNYRDSEGNEYSGEITEDGEYAYLSLPSEAPQSIVIDSIDYWNSEPIHLIAGSKQITVEYEEKDTPLNKVYSSVADMELDACPTVGIGQYGVVGNNAYKFSNNEEWNTVSSVKFVGKYDGGLANVIECGSSSSLFANETKPSYITSQMTTASIGNCVTTLEGYAFGGCSSLTSITVPNNVTYINSGVFSNCTSLTSVDLPSGITSINGNTFYNCISLTNLDIPSGVTTIGNAAFYNCRSLTSIVIPNGVTSINQTTFSNCNSLTSCTIGSGVTTIGNGAFQNAGLVSLHIPSGVTSISANAFSNCSSLTSITVDSNNSAYDSRNNCNALIKTSTNELILGCGNTIIPNGVITIGNAAFINCSGLTGNFDIPNSVRTIGSNAFRPCSGLTSITIGTGISNIGMYAFYGCSSLTSITVNAVTPPSLSNANAFTNTNNCPIYVPCGSVDTYKAAKRWSSLASRITCVQPKTLQWVTYNNGDVIPSDLDIYGFSGVSQNLNDTFGYGTHFQFTPSRNKIDWFIVNNNGHTCYFGDSVLNTEVISVIFSEVSCDDYYNQGATVSGTIQLYIYA